MSDMIGRIAAEAGKLAGKLPGNNTRRHACDLCGRTCEETKTIVLGSEGNVCRDCAQRCLNTDYKQAQFSAVNGVPITVVLAGRCVLCDRNAQQVGTLWMGTQGGVCASCLQLCQEMMASR